MPKFRGTNGNDVLRGGRRNDSIFGLAGDDILFGGAGNDVLNGAAGNDTLNGGSANDVLKGGSGHNVLNGGSGKDRLIGGADLDTLDGGSGSDRMEGRGGSDVYIVDNIRDRIIEIPDISLGGIDLVRSRLSINLKSATFGAGNVEKAELLGTSNGFVKGTNHTDTLTGNSGNNLIQGFGGVDSLIGGAGNDVLEGGDDDSADILDGGAGADTLRGGLGSDIYTIDNIGDVIEDTGGDRDLVKSFLAMDIDLNDSKFFGIENATLLASGEFNITGTNTRNSLTGNSRRNTLNGLGGNDFLLGEGDNDTLNGGDGEDTLAGGTGSDVVQGGAGSDQFSNDSKMGDIDRYLYDAGDIQVGFIDTYTGTLDSDDFLDLSAYIALKIQPSDTALDRIDDFIDIRPSNTTHDVNTDGFDLILHPNGGYSTATELVIFATFLHMHAAIGVAIKIFDSNGTEIASELIQKTVNS